jgi:hypothetical protein
MNDEVSDESPPTMLRVILGHMATLFGADADPHLGDDAHALDHDEDIDETEDLEDGF